MPCDGTLQRDLLYMYLLSEIQGIIDLHNNYDVLTDGDFNTDSNCHRKLSVAVNAFIDQN